MSFQSSLESILGGLSDYADAHKARYGTPIGADYYISEQWTTTANGLLGLLNGETGRIDCGTFDGQVRKLAARHDVDLDQ